MDDFKRSQVPAFGNWDYEDGMPITQYFESARQAGLFRYSYGEGDLYTTNYAYEQDLYLKPTHTIAVVPRRKTKGAVEYEYSYDKEQQKKQGRVHDLTMTASQEVQTAPPKAIDEDLYKIPPEMLCMNPKKRRMFGFFTRCLVPFCVV